MVRVRDILNEYSDLGQSASTGLGLILFAVRYVLANEGQQNNYAVGFGARIGRIMEHNDEAFPSKLPVSFPERLRLLACSLAELAEMHIEEQGWNDEHLRRQVLREEMELFRCKSSTAKKTAAKEPSKKNAKKKSAKKKSAKKKTARKKTAKRNRKRRQ